MASDTKSQRPQSAIPRIIPAIPRSLTKPQNKRLVSPLQSQKESVDTPATTGEDDVVPSKSSNQDRHSEEEELVLAGANGSITPISNVAQTNHLATLNQSEPSDVNRVVAKTSPCDVHSEGTASVAQVSDADKPINATQPPVRELPPAFYPAHHRSNPSSATTTSHNQDIPSNVSALQQAQTASNGLVFGGQRDSANSSPIPAPANVPLQFSQPPYASYGPQVLGPTPFFPNGHSYNVSEPHMGPTYPPSFVHNQNTLAYPKDFYSNGPAAFTQSRPFQPLNARYSNNMRYADDYPPQQRFPPPPQRFYPGSHQAALLAKRPEAGEQSRAIHPDLMPSASPTTDNLLRNQLPGPPTPLQHNHINGQSITQESGNANSPRTENNVYLAAADDSASLLQYLHSQFGSRDFADYVVDLSHSSYLFSATMVSCHGILLSRSPKLRSLMAMQHAGHQNYPRMLNIVIRDRFLNHDAALIKALLRLYGEILPDQAFIASMRGHSAEGDLGSFNSAQQMQFALAYAAAGHFLQVDEIINRGLDLATGLLSWDTIEKALAFALEGGVSSAWTQFDPVTEDVGSTSSTDDNATKLDSPISGPVYGIYSDRLLNYILDFLAHTCATDFHVLKAAPQSPDIPRLPLVAEPHASRSSSRFSQIHFGEMTLEEQNNHDAATSTMSTVLLSLPPSLLHHFFHHPVLGERLGWPKIQEIMQNVVDERERRRQQAVRSREGTVPSSIFEERLWQNVRQVEYVEQTERYPAGAKIAVRRMGTETPPSAASAKS